MPSCVRELEEPLSEGDIALIRGTEEVDAHILRSSRARWAIGLRSSEL